MGKYLKDYITNIEELLKDKKEIESKKLKEEMLIKISFFQHERLIHLLVTLFFGIILILFLILLQFEQAVLFAIIPVLILLCFYVVHYYKLENGVQYLYNLYDKVDEVGKK